MHLKICKENTIHQQLIFIVSLFLILLLNWLRIMSLTVLIKFGLLKTVDSIMRWHTLMLLILIQTITIVTLPLNILTLKVLRLILIFLQNIVLTSVGLVTAFTVRSSRIKGLSWCVGVHQISFIALIQHRTWRFGSTYTLRFWIAKDISLRKRIGSRADRARGHKSLRLLCSLNLRVA